MALKDPHGVADVRHSDQHSEEWNGLRKPFGNRLQLGVGNDGNLSLYLRRDQPFNLADHVLRHGAWRRTGLQHQHAAGSDEDNLSAGILAWSVLTGGGLSRLIEDPMNVSWLVHLGHARFEEIRRFGHERSGFAAPNHCAGNHGGHRPASEMPPVER